MTLTELRYIVAVSQKNHFGRAAQACFVSQPTLSIAIKKLEEELGVRLFERSSKNEIRITDIGQQVINQAYIVLQQSQLLSEIAQQGKDPLSGPFRLGPRGPARGAFRFESPLCLFTVPCKSSTVWGGDLVGGAIGAYPMVWNRESGHFPVSAAACLGANRSDGRRCFIVL